MPDSVALNDFRRASEATATQRAAALQARAAKQRELAEVERRIARSPMADTGLLMSRDVLKRDLAGNRDLIDRLDKARGRLGDLFVTDACDAGAAEPLLLLPIRLETRFRDVGGVTQLMIRIFPDTVHIDRLKRSLSPDERSAGIAYWSGLWDGGKAATLWATLGQTVGRSRAPWVAHATRPSNAPGGLGRPQFPAAVDVPDEATIARLLPDRFVATARQKGKTARATGKTVPASLRLGLFLSDEDEADIKIVNGLPSGLGSEWIADYAAAEAAGMAITLPLPTNATVDSLIVTGVRQSLTPAAAATALAALLEAHSFSDGLAFVPQGTPSNSIDVDRAGAAPDLDTPPDFPPAPVDAGIRTAAAGNAARLAAALDVPAAVFARADHGSNEEDTLARAVNSALWWPSWGNFLDGLDVSAKGSDLDLTDQQLERVRRFHRDRVRGRGPLPAVRIGSQPYGVLPAGTTDAWALSGFDAQLLSVVKRVRAIWRASLDRVPHIGAGKVDATTLELMGSSPVSLGVRARAVVSTWAIGPGKAGGIVTDEDRLESMLNTLLWEQVANVTLSSHFTSLDAKSKPVGLPLADDSDAERLIAIVNSPSKGGEVKSVLQALAAIGAAYARSRDKIDGKTPFGPVDYGGLTAGLDPRQKAAADRFADTARAVAAGNTVSAATMYEAADALYATVSAGGRARNYTSAGATKSFLELSRGAITDLARAEYNREALPELFTASAIRKEVEAALAMLAKATTEERRIATAEALDIASHRLDAWVTGVVEQRRVALRSATPKGVQIGAYGVVLDIKRTAKTPDYGFVQAPSPEQAVTAGLLRSAYLAHSKEGGSGAFAIDLSSARVRDAMDLLDSMRTGQALGEALGYRIERFLHDVKPVERRLDRVIRNLRRFAPLRLGKLTDRGVAVEPIAQENVAGATVLDGVALVERFRKDGIAPIAAAAFQLPVDNPYLDPSKWPAPTPTDQTTLLDSIAAAASVLDAASDLLLAESVHQMAHGNMPRASAALDAGGTGDSPPPTPAVVLTPASGGSLTHKVLLVVVPGGGWGPNSARTVAEPRLEAWAAARLGTPSTIVVAMAPNGTLLTLNQASMAAIDFVYAAGDVAALDARVAAALNLPAGTKLADTRDAAWPGGMRAYGDVVQAAAALRRVLASAVVAGPKDLTAPNDPDQRVVTASLADAFDRANMAISTLQTQITAGSGALPDPEAWLLGMADMGIAVPAGGIRSEVAKLVLEEAKQRYAAAKLAAAKPPSQAMLTELAQAVFGDGFWILAPFDPPGAADAWTVALGQFDTLAKPSAIRRWLADIGAVRPLVRDFADSLLLSEAIGAPPPRLGAVQIRRLEAAPATGPEAWVGNASADAFTASWVVEAPAGYAPGAPTAALLVDAHVEALVDRETRTTGVAFNAPSPSARPPQSWLLGIAGDDRRWTTDSVVALIDDTLELSKLRGLTLERLKTAPRILPALYQQSHSLQGEELVFMIDMFPTLFATALSFIKED